MKKRIFISYSRDDERFAEDLERRLRELDRYDVRRDRRVLLGGEDWWRQLQAEIETADTLVLCVSQHSLKSDNVRAEWRHAKKSGTHVIPIAANAIDYKALPKWLTRVHIPALYSGAPGLEEAWAGFIDTLDKPYVPYFAPLMGDPPEYFVNRPEEYDRIKRALLDESGSYVGITGVVGGGGFGKTTLAQALSRDEDVLDWFYDGILWLTLGEAATEDSILAGVRDLIKKMTGKDATETTRDGLKSTLREAISDRYVLIVLDDVWTGAYRVIVDSPGRNARILVTTRKPNLLPYDAQSTHVNAMKDSEARALLCRGLSNANDARLGALVKQLGYWALLLKLANGQLHRRMARGASLDQAITWVIDALKRKSFEALSNPEDANTRNRAASASIGVSIAMLDDLERNRFEALSIFAEDVDIPLTTLARLWDCDEFNVEECCEALFRLSLLLTYDLKNRSIRLHDVVRTYLRDMNRELMPQWNKAFLDAFSLTDWTVLPQTETYLWRHLAWHLSESGQSEVLSKLLSNFKWLQAKLNATDSAALLSDFDVAYDDEALQLIQSAVRLSLHAITADKRQLAPQLAGRLFTHRNQSRVAALLDSAFYPKMTFKSESLRFPSHIQAGGSLICVMHEHTDFIEGVLTLADGRFLSWSKDKTLIIWASDGALLHIITSELTSPVKGAVELRDGRLLTWLWNGTLLLRSREGNILCALVKGHSHSVNGALELRDGKLLSWSDDRDLCLWDATGKLLYKLFGHSKKVTGGLELSSGRFLSWSHDKTLRLWEGDGTYVGTLHGHENWVAGALELKDKSILSWSWDHTLRHWTSEGKERSVLKSHSLPILGALELNDGRILSWSGDKTLRLWTLEPEQVAVLIGHTNTVAGALSLASGKIISWSDDRTLRLWSKDGEPLTEMLGHTRPVSGVVEMDDGFLVSWQMEGEEILIWNTEGMQIGVLKGHSHRVVGALSLGDKRLLSWSDDKTLRFWQVSSDLYDVPRTHMSAVNNIRMLSNGNFVTYSSDGTIQLWNIEGVILSTLRHKSVRRQSLSDT